jgi:hypothetical protein
MPIPVPGVAYATDRDAVELGSYPPPSAPNSNPNPSYPSAAPPPNPNPGFAPPPPNPNPNPNPDFAPPPTHTPDGSWSTRFAPPSAPTTTTAEPGPASSPAARQAYLAAELRAAQSLLERSSTKLSGGDGDGKSREAREREVKATKARIRELEARQTSAWALGLE